LAFPLSSPSQATAISKPRSYLDPLRYRDLVSAGVRQARHIEALEMAEAILGGSQMGPGEGWFHGSQSRYGWPWLTARYDENHDGKITRQQFGGPAEFFDWLDRNGDGVLTAEDFDWSDRSAFVRQAGFANQVMSFLDADGNGRVSRAEWESFFAKAARGKDHLTADDLRAALTPPVPPAGKTGSGGPSPLLLLSGLFSGEIGSFHEGPAVGALAPGFSLKTVDGDQEVRLDSYRGKNPVVLIFGSFT
jgi:hypothetical protein